MDRTLYSLRPALENPLNTDLFDAAIPGFALRSPYRHHYILGDTTDLADAQDDAYIDEFLK